MRIALDAMGGDHGPGTLVEGARAAVRSGHDVVLVGDRQILDPLCRRTKLPIHHASDAVGMDESPAVIRRREDVSVRRAMALMRDGGADAVVSCGSTGATLFSAMLDLGTLEGIERPAIATHLPRRDGRRLVLMDAGANVDCKPEMLATFALMGSAYAELSGVDGPRVGLLSNGEEAGKGNMQVKATAPLLERLPIDFVGNVEPTDAMAGACDVLVCDGFVGNILLKAAEGAVETVIALLREEIVRRPSGRLGAWLLQGAFRRFRERVAWDAVGGGLLLGVDGVVVVGHGRANPEAVTAAIELAATAARVGLTRRIEAGLQASR